MRKVHFYSPQSHECSQLSPTMEKLAELLHGIAKVGAMDCTGNAERFCVRQGVREFPGVMLVVDGKATSFEGNTGETEDAVYLIQTVPLRARRPHSCASNPLTKIIPLPLLFSQDKDPPGRARASGEEVGCFDMTMGIIYFGVSVAPSACSTCGTSSFIRSPRPLRHHPTWTGLCVDAKSLHAFVLEGLPAEHVANLRRRDQADRFLQSECQKGSAWGVCGVLFTDKFETSSALKALSFRYRDRVSQITHDVLPDVRG